MKRRITAFLLACLTLVLCACGGTSTASKPVESKPTEKPEVIREERTEQDMEESTTPAKEPETEETPDNPDEQIRPEIKEAIDSYEAFVDEYCTFMTEYSLTDLSKLSTYNELIQKELVMTQKFEALEKEELTTAEALYYSEVSLRCSQKMLDIASKMLK